MDNKDVKDVNINLPLDISFPYEITHDIFSELLKTETVEAQHPDDMLADAAMLGDAENPICFSSDEDEDIEVVKTIIKEKKTLQTKDPLPIEVEINEPVPGVAYPSFLTTYCKGLFSSYLTQRAVISSPFLRHDLLKLFMRANNIDFTDDESPREHWLRMWTFYETKLREAGHEDYEGQLLWEMPMRRGGVLRKSDQAIINECIICMEDQIQVCLIPCGHTILCSRCAVKISVCPVCTNPIERVQRIYFG